MEFQSTTIAGGLALYSLLSLWLSFDLTQFIWYRLTIRPLSHTERGEELLVLPGRHSGAIQVVLEETVRYRHPNEEAAKEWFYANPQGAGSYRVSDYKTLFITMLHQYHCIETFGEQLTRAKRDDWGHLQHCMNYLREMALCRPDLTLEFGDFSKRNFTAERTGATHICRNLDPVYDSLKENWMDWAHERQQRFQKSTKVI